MTEAQRDDLILELSFYSPSQIRQIVANYQQHPKPDNGNYSFYDFLEDKIGNDTNGKKVALT